MTRRTAPPRRIAAATAAAALTYSAATGCGLISAAGLANPPPEPVVVTATVQDWNGWSRQQPPPEPPRRVTVRAGSAFSVGVITGRVRIRVVSITDHRMRVQTDQPMILITPEGRFPVGRDGTLFTLRRGVPIQIDTPTWDAGTSVTLRWA